MLCSGLFVYVARRIFRQTSSVVLCLGGLLFATHPIHTDAVSSVNNRTELLAALFAMLSFLTYASAFKPHDRINVSYVRILASILLAGIGVLCKEQCLMVLGVNAAYDFSAVCELDVATFVAALFGGGSSTKAKADDSTTVTPPPHAGGDGAVAGNGAVAGTGAADDATKTDANKGVAEDDSVTAKTAVAENSIWLRALLVRIALIGVGTVLIFWLRIQQNLLAHELVNSDQCRMISRSFEISFMHSRLAAAAIGLKNWKFRFLTKSWYAAMHLWLLIFPRTLCIDYSGRSYVASMTR